MTETIYSHRRLRTTTVLYAHSCALLLRSRCKIESSHHCTFKSHGSSVILLHCIGRHIPAFHFCHQPRSFSISSTNFAEDYRVPSDWQKRDIFEIFQFSAEKCRVRGSLRTKSELSAHQISCANHLRTKNPIFRREFEVPRYLTVA